MSYIAYELTQLNSIFHEHDQTWSIKQCIQANMVKKTMYGMIDDTLLLLAHISRFHNLKKPLGAG
ncbi:hypothetical protein YC2023_072886 [Brassica napus]